MNPDRRIVSRGHGPSDDSGSDDEENLRVSKCLKTYEHIIDRTAGLSVFLPSVTKFIPERIKHSNYIYYFINNKKKTGFRINNMKLYPIEKKVGSSFSEKL